MGRHFEVRAASMAKTAQKKSTLYMRASKEIYMAAKQGEPNPDMNMALRAVMEKYRGQGVPKEIIERAINKAHGIGEEDTQYVEGQYEAMGPGGWMMVVQTLSDNATRAFNEIRSNTVKKDGQMTTVNYAFEELGVFVFSGDNVDEVEETLILSDIDVQDIEHEGGKIQVQVTPSHFGKTRDTLMNDLGVKDFDMAEIRMIAQDLVKLSGEDEKKFLELLDKLDDLEDVQAIFHNVELNED